jgi:hypothetical protein
MRLQLALCLLLVACGGSKPKSTMPEASSTAAPGGGEPAEAAAPAAEPIEASKAEPATAPPPTPMATPAPKPTTRGATTKPKKSEDPDAGGE